MSKKAAKAGILGAIIGALAGIFVLAPKGAKENRQDAKDKVLKGKADAEKKLKASYSEIDALAKDLKARGKKLTGKAKTESQGLVDQAEALKLKFKDLIAHVRDDAADIASEVETTIKEGKGLAQKMKEATKKEAKAVSKRAK